jgi:hypothetical protein
MAKKARKKCDAASRTGRVGESVVAELLTGYTNSIDLRTPNPDVKLHILSLGQNDASLLEPLLKR